MWKVVLLLLCSGMSMSLSAQSPKVLAFAGSARAGSVNKKLIQEVARIASDMGADVAYIDLKDYPIPFYDADVEAESGMPENAKEIRNLMINSQVIFIASPEYNHSLSALLKNTIDWASRNESKGASRDAFKGKKFLIMSAAPGRGGGARGLTHLRAIIEDIGGTVNPEILALSNAYQAFDEQGKIKDPRLIAEIQRLVTSMLN